MAAADGDIQDLAGRVAIVTGAGRGIGRALALGLGARGASVGVMARSQTELDSVVADLIAVGARAVAAAGDISDADSVSAGIFAIEAELGPVDVLVNNAGINIGFGPVSEFDVDEWWRTMEVNLRGPVLATRIAAEGMAARRRGRIINIASVGALRAVPNFSAYSVSKTALMRFTEHIAAELADFNVTAFAVNPGPVKTTLNDGVIESEATKRFAAGFADYMAANARDPEYIAPLVLRLARGDADGLSGALISVTDDLDALIAAADRIVTEQRYVLRMRTLDGEAAAKSFDANR